MALIDRDGLTCIGIVAKAHGVRGELKVTARSDTPEYYTGMKSVILETADGLRPFSVGAVRTAGGCWVMRLEGVTSRDQAESLRGAEVLLENSLLRPLERDEYFQHDLIGCAVETLGGRGLGRVEEVLETGANEVLAVGGAGGRVMIPLTREVVREVDMGARLIRIEPLPGLLEAGEEP